MTKIPADVLLITVGADVQDDRIEVSYAGFSRDGTAYVLGHIVLYGPVTAPGVWQDLDDVLKQRFVHPHGGVIGIDAAIVDAGDGGVYDVVMKFAERVRLAGFQQSARLKSRGAQRLYLFGSDSIKSLLFQRLKRGQTIRFSDTLDAGYFEQLASERLITKMSRGRPERRFERIPGRRAETLDCLTMAYAARQGLALNLDAREEALKLHPASAAPPRVTRSKWLSGL